MVDVAAKLQMELGLSLSDPKEARKNLYEYFRAYRICKRMLMREKIPHRAQLPARIGYENAGDPDLIRTPHVHGGAPTGWVEQEDEDLLDPQERQWAAFVRKVDRHVRRLKDYQRDIIKMRFLGEEPLPSDTEVHMKLRDQGWYVSERYYDDEKAEAIQRLAASLRVTEAEV